MKPLKSDCCNDYITTITVTTDKTISTHPVCICCMKGPVFKIETYNSLKKFIENRQIKNQKLQQQNNEN